MILKGILFFLKKNKAVSIVIFILIMALAYYIYLHRRPFTQNAFIVANIHPVTAFISGYITDIYVENNSFVKKGQKILTVYRRPYELQVQVLRKKNEAAKYLLESLEYDLKIAKNKVKDAEAELENARYLSGQATLLYKQQAVSQKHAEKLEEAKKEALSVLRENKGNYTSIKAKIAKEKADLESLNAQLEKAEVELALTTVYALNDGIVCNMYFSEGSYVKAGNPLFAFINNKTWWIQANFKETQLSSIKEGQTAKIWLWQYPGKVYNGVVESTEWGVERRYTADNSGMSVVKKENEWFLLPQRFPVQIRILEPDPDYPLHPGASAFVEVQADAHPIRQFFWQLFQI